MVYLTMLSSTEKHEKVGITLLVVVWESAEAQPARNV